MNSYKLITLCRVTWTLLHVIRLVWPKHVKKLSLLKAATVQGLTSGVCSEGDSRLPRCFLSCLWLCTRLARADERCGAVRVINCDGNAQTSAIIAGLDWLAQNYKLPAVASMSLGSDSPSDALDAAVKAIINLGISAVIAAGNYNQGGVW